MPNARHVLALLKTHIRGDDQEFMSIAMQVAAQEARQGHSKVAQQIRDLVDRAKIERNHSQQRLLVIEPKGDLASLVSLQEPTARLASLVLPTDLEARLRRVLLEYRQQRRLRDNGLQARRKLLFIGAPGTGKTTAAAAMAGELVNFIFRCWWRGLRALLRSFRKVNLGDKVHASRQGFT